MKIVKKDFSIYIAFLLIYKHFKLSVSELTLTYFCWYLILLLLANPDFKNGIFRAFLNGKWFNSKIIYISIQSPISNTKNLAIHFKTFYKYIYNTYFHLCLYFYIFIFLYFHIFMFLCYFVFVYLYFLSLCFFLYFYISRFL